VGQNVEKEPLQGESILLEGINAGDAASRALLIEYYSDQQGLLFSLRKKLNSKKQLNLIKEPLIKSGSNRLLVITFWFKA